jgi:hypothetical protein
MSYQPFYLGVNYPWNRYAQDFGLTAAGRHGTSLPENRTLLASEFARIRDCGATVVRWFLFGDGRGGFLSEKGIPRHPDELLYFDIEAALEVAQQSGLQLCFSLIDYPWLQDRSSKDALHSNERVMQFAAGREAFLYRVLIPIFHGFRQHPALFAWEIANEPEWAIREFHRAQSAKMHYADFRAFAAETAAAVREFAKVSVTLGSARLDWVRAWTELHLDFYQAHYYPSPGADCFAELAEQCASLHSLDKPLWLGEIPARDARAERYSLESTLSRCQDAGLMGAAVWRWTVPEAAGTDLHIGSVDPQLLARWSSRSRTKSAVV